MHQTLFGPLPVSIIFRTSQRKSRARSITTSWGSINKQRLQVEARAVAGCECTRGSRGQNSRAVAAKAKNEQVSWAVYVHCNGNAQSELTDELIQSTA